MHGTQSHLKENIPAQHQNHHDGENDISNDFHPAWIQQGRNFSFVGHGLDQMGRIAPNVKGPLPKIKRDH
jgi:hypothetical protein